MELKSFLPALASVPLIACEPPKSVEAPPKELAYTMDDLARLLAVTVQAHTEEQAELQPLEDAALSAVWDPDAVMDMDVLNTLGTVDSPWHSLETLSDGEATLPLVRVDEHIGSAGEECGGRDEDLNYSVYVRLNEDSFENSAVFSAVFYCLDSVHVATQMNLSFKVYSTALGTEEDLEQTYAVTGGVETRESSSVWDLEYVFGPFGDRMSGEENGTFTQEEAVSYLEALRLDLFRNPASHLSTWLEADYLSDNDGPWSTGFTQIFSYSPEDGVVILSE